MQLSELNEIERANAKWIGELFMRYQLMEECGELVKAISKYHRTIGIGQPTETTTDKAYDDLVSELVDVQICIDSLVYLMGISGEEIQAKKRDAISKVAQRRLENE